MSDRKIQLDPDLAAALLASPSTQAGLEGTEGETLGQTIKRLQAQLEEAVKAASSSLANNPLAAIVARDQGALKGIPGASIQISQDGTLWLSQGVVSVEVPDTFVAPPKTATPQKSSRSSKNRKNTPNKEDLREIGEALNMPFEGTKMKFWEKVCKHLKQKTGFDAAAAYPEDLDKIWEVIRSLETAPLPQVPETPPVYEPELEPPPKPKRTPAPPRVEEDLDLGDLINDSRSEVLKEEVPKEEVGDDGVEEEYYTYHEHDEFEPPYLKPSLPKSKSPSKPVGLLGDILRKAQDLDLEAAVDRINSES